MYTITLHDGAKLENLELNGNNFISATLIEDSVFENNLETVTISDGENSQTYTDMQLLSNRVDKLDGRSWFVLGEKSPQQKKEEAMAKSLEEMENNILSAINALGDADELQTYYSMTQSLLTGGESA